MAATILVSDYRRIWTALALVVLTAAGGVPTAGAASLLSPTVTAGDRGGNGPSNGVPDAFMLVREGSRVAVYLNGVPSRSWPLDTVDTLTVDGSDDDDTLTVDFSGGNPIPRGGLHYNGGANGPAGDALHLVGGALTQVAYRFANRTDGSIDVDGSEIVYTGLEPILDTTTVTNFTVLGTNLPNVISCLASQTGNFGEIDVDANEIIQFANKTTLIIDAMNGNDQIYIGPFGAPGLTSVVVHAGAGDDVISVAAGAAQPITILGEDGDDVIRVAPSPNASISVDGGSEVVGDHLLVVAGANKAKKTATAVSVDGMQDVTYSNIEGVDVVTKSNLKKFLP
jgi:hypothetical protein